MSPRASPGRIRGLTDRAPNSLYADRAASGTLTLRRSYRWDPDKVCDHVGNILRDLVRLDASLPKTLRHSGEEGLDGERLLERIVEARVIAAV